MMKKLMMAAAGGTVLGLVATTQVAGPLLAQESDSVISISSLTCLAIFSNGSAKDTSRMSTKRT